MFFKNKKRGQGVAAATPSPKPKIFFMKRGRGFAATPAGDASTLAPVPSPEVAAATLTAGVVAPIAGVAMDDLVKLVDQSVDKKLAEKELQAKAAEDALTIGMATLNLAAAVSPLRKDKTKFPPQPVWDREKNTWRFCMKCVSTNSGRCGTHPVGNKYPASVSDAKYREAYAYELAKANTLAFPPPSTAVAPAPATPAPTVATGPAAAAAAPPHSV